jgi:hypothetical protein
MSRSLASIEQFKDRRWLVRRAHEENVQVATYKWWILNCKALGINDYRLAYAQGSWLGKAKGSAFFVLTRLHALGYCPEAPRLMLAVPRGGFHALMLWFMHPESRESPEELRMKEALASQGYQVGTFTNAHQACLDISDYLLAPAPGCP